MPKNHPAFRFSQEARLFYNRKLKRLVVVELKQGSFKPEYKSYGTLPALAGEV